MDALAVHCEGDFVDLLETEISVEAMRHDLDLDLDYCVFVCAVIKPSSWETYLRGDPIGGRAAMERESSWQTAQTRMQWYWPLVVQRSWASSRHLPLHPCLHPCLGRYHCILVCAALNRKSANQNLKLLQVERVQNVTLWSWYAAKRYAMVLRQGATDSVKEASRIHEYQEEVDI